MIYEETTHKIIGCCMTVHSKIGCGFQEVIYQRALAIELAKNNVSFVREKEMKIFYDETEIGTRRVDFLIDDIICLELKAVGAFEDYHFVQALNYLEVYNLPMGLLINFGAKSLEFKRIHNNKHPLNKKSFNQPNP